MRVWFYKGYMGILMLVPLLSLAAFTAPDVIVFKDEVSAFKPDGYYIASVTDNRPLKGDVAHLIIVSPNKKPIVQAAGFEDGAEQAISKFLSRNVERITSQRPVNIGIKELKITETLLPGNKIEGQLKISMTFSLEKNYGTELLVTYHGGLRYTRMTNSAATAEMHFRTAIKNGLSFFNNWMQNNRDNNIKLAKKVTVTFKTYYDKTEGDTIYYAANRKLTWADFQSRVAPGGPYSAVVLPGFGYDEQHKVADGLIHVELNMKTYLPKSACWADSFGRNNYSLNHEQRHFDIARIITRQYQQKVIDAKLTPENWEAFIGMQYLDSYRDLHAMQTAYDKETAHGRNQLVQEEWNKSIDKQLTAGLKLLN